MCIRIDDNHQIALAKCTATTRTTSATATAAISTMRTTTSLWLQPDTAAAFLDAFLWWGFSPSLSQLNATDLRPLSENFIVNWVWHLKYFSKAANWLQKAFFNHHFAWFFHASHTVPQSMSCNYKNITDFLCRKGVKFNKYI